MSSKKAWIAAILIVVAWIATNAAMIALMMDAAQAEALRPHYPENGLPWATVNASNVNFREGPGKEYRVRQQWSRGCAVEVVGEQDGWVQVLRWTSPDPLWVWHEYLTMVE